MKIVFLHVYSEKNTGDAAIVHVMLRKYIQLYPGAEIVLSSITKQQHKSFMDAEYISSFFQEAIYRSDSAKVRALRTFAICLGAYFRGKFFGGRLREFVQHIKSADLIVGVGGGYIQADATVHDWVTLVLTLIEIWFCKREGKQVILEAMSIGPFATNWQKKLAAKVLNQVDTIFVRENITAACLKNIGVVTPTITKAVDLGFYFKPKTKEKMKNYLMKRGVFFTKPVLGITVKKCFALDDPRQRAYEEGIAGFVNQVLKDKDMKVVFIPHVTAKMQHDDDREIIQRIKPLLIYKEKTILLMEEYNYQDIKGIYENLTWLVGTRMHSVIFALTAQVPVVAIGYEPKTLGIMKTLGLEKNVLQADKVTTPALYSAFSAL